MEEDYSKLEQGMKALFSKTLLVLYTSLLAFTNSRAETGASLTTESLVPDDDFVARFSNLKRRPQLVLKLNMGNWSASKSMMHTSHRSHSSHSSHSSHYSSSSSGHSSHVSHSSHYSSSSYGSGSGSSPSYYTTPTLPSYRPSTTRRSTKKRSSSSRVRSYSSYSGSSPYPSTTYMSLLTLGDRVLKLGDKGNDVQELQVLLLGKGYDVSLDGDFGLGTNSAVKSFQASKGLTADGVVGAQTIAALRGY